jgi:hypothetical protein
MEQLREKKQAVLKIAIKVAFGGCFDQHEAREIVEVFPMINPTAENLTLALQEALFCALVGHEPYEAGWNQREFSEHD